MSIAATSALMALVKSAAGTTSVKSGERRIVGRQRHEIDRPYFLVSFGAVGQPTGIPRRKRGVALIECYAATMVDAWALGPALTKAMGLNGYMTAPERPNAIDTLELTTAGWVRGSDPNDGGHTFCNVVFYYFD